MNDHASETATKKLALIAVSVVTTLLMLEIGIRIHDTVRGWGFFYEGRNRTARAEKAERPFRGFGFDAYRDRDAVRYIASTHGELYPFAKPEGTLRIVAFGGSTTVNEFSNKHGGGHYPLLLQSMIRERKGIDVEVINAAFSAYATPHSLILLALDVITWDPDIVILSHNINDLLVGYFPGFRPDYSHKYINPNFRRNRSLVDSTFQHFQLYWLLRKGVRRVWREMTAVILRESYGHEPPREALEVFRRNLQSFVTLAKANGIRVLLASQALEPSEEYFTRHILPKLYNKMIYYPLHSEFLSHHHAYNRVIEEVALENGVWFLDNDRLFDGRSEFFTDFVHYSKPGVEKLAQNYADFLVERIGGADHASAAPRAALQE